MAKKTTLYEYRYDLYYKHFSLREYECIETDKMYRTADRSMFHTTYTTQVSKEAIPIVQENIDICVLSDIPLNSEEVKFLMIRPYQQSIERMRKVISELNEKIYNIMGAEGGEQNENSN